MILVGIVLLLAGFFAWALVHGGKRLRRAEATQLHNAYNKRYDDEENGEWQ